MTSLSSNKGLRLFVAAELPLSWREGLGRLQEGLRARLEPAVGLRWVRPEGIHLTLKFLGETDPALLEDIEEALAMAVPRPLDISLVPGRVETFGARRSIRVAWFGVEGETEKLAAVVSEVDRTMNRLGFALGQRPLAPHLTLARVPEGLPPVAHDAIRAALGAATNTGLEPFTVEYVSLISSKLGPGGARYETIARFPRIDSDK